MFTFLLTAAICLGGSLGVVLLRNPVHNALSLVATLFGVAVLFIQQGAYFLAAIQVIVYAGAIVILFLFVIMLLGVDRAEGFDREPILGQRPAAVAAGVAILGLSLTALLSVGARVTGQASTLAAIDGTEPNINALAKVLFTDYVFAFEITSVLLTVAVVGAVVLSRKAGPAIDLAEFPDGTTAALMQAKHEAAFEELESEPEAEAALNTEDETPEGEAEITEEALR
ncbi:MAG: NADH-quinone oxidoreductase subunit J [Actinomycetes bacterium]